jgi:hypothetical protein
VANDIDGLNKRGAPGQALDGRSRVGESHPSIGLTTLYAWYVAGVVEPGRRPDAGAGVEPVP